MFSFFKRKKKPETPETATEQPATVENTTESAAKPAAVAPKPETADSTPIVDAISESAPSSPALSEAEQHAITEDAAANPVDSLVADVISSNERLPEQFDSVEPIAETHIPLSELSAESIEDTADNTNATADNFKQPDIATPVPAAATITEEPAKLGWAARLKQGLTKSRDQMAKSLASVFGGGQIDEDLYEELETVLITSDMGIEATEYLMKDVRKRVSLKGLKDGHELRDALKDAIYDLIKPLEQPLVVPDSSEPFVIMLAGINGAGKTTSIGKLAKYFQAQGKSVLLAAGDTFRAAAREQLQEWGARNGVTVISQASGDSAAVCFDAVEAAKARGIDIVLADTAGRLPTQLHLMEEIKKVKRVLQKAMPAAPHEIIVVLDANIGQNAINQVVAFDDALGLTGLIVTKLDGTAKGGVLAALASNRPIPVRYIGVGEKIDDLRPFDARAFVDALFD